MVKERLMTPTEKPKTHREEHPAVFSSLYGIWDLEAAAPSLVTNEASLAFLVAASLYY